MCVLCTYSGFIVESNTKFVCKKVSNIISLSREEQRRLEERLRQLREEEDRLERDGRTGVQLQEEAESVRLRVEERKRRRWGGGIMCGFVLCCRPFRRPRETFQSGGRELRG